MIYKVGSFAISQRYRVVYGNAKDDQKGEIVIKGQEAAPTLRQANFINDTQLKGG